MTCLRGKGGVDVGDMRGGDMMDKLICTLLKWHSWKYEAMSLEAYARTFRYCEHCGIMEYRQEWQG